MRIAAALSALLVAAFCFLGIYAHPQADDFAFASDVIENGFGASQWLSGRTANTFLVSAACYAGIENIYPLLPLINAALVFASLFFLLRALPNSGGAVSASLVLLAAWLAFVPSLNETFYWLCGMPYTWTAAVSLMCAALLLRALSRREKWTAFFVLPLCVFLGGTILEQTCIIQMLLLFCLTVRYFRMRPLGVSDSFSALTVGTAFAAALAAFLLMYLSPRTAARMAVSGDLAKNFFQTAGVAVIFGAITAVKFFISPIVYAPLLFLPDIAQKQDPLGMPNLRAWHIVAVTAVLAPFQQAIGGWAMGAGLPARSESLALWIMAACWVSMWAFFYRNDAVISRIRSWGIYRWRWGILAVCLLANPNVVQLLSDLKIAPQYNAEMRQRILSIDEQKGEGKEDITVAALTVRPRLLFFSDIRPFPNDWKNHSMAKYFGVRSITAMPTAEDEAFMLAEAYDSTFAPVDGVPKDNAKAAALYLETAEAGGYESAHACRRLSRLYAIGAGVPRNYLRAVWWLVMSQRTAVPTRTFVPKT
ncbi:MAG: DUF6056 family protein [Synergistaceae bacterium]|jgi:hypothetical protein|nr:DUF6056 family protein [Synergistaceae bacterium]